MNIVDLEARVRQLLVEKVKAAAVQEVRQITDWGLRQAKDFVDALTSGDNKPVEHYQALSTDEILHHLEFGGRHVDPNLIRACLERQQDLTPGLLALLSGGVDYDWDENDPRWYCEIHAGILLTAYREPEALPLFDKIIRDPDCDTLMEWFHFPIAENYGPMAVPMLLAMLNDESVYEYARTTVTGMLSYIGVNHAETRAQIVEALREHLPDLDAQGTLVITVEQRRNPPEFWVWVVDALMALRDEQTQPQVRALFEHELLDEMIFGGLEDYMAAFEPDAPLPLDARHNYDFLNDYDSRFKQIQMSQQRHVDASIQRAVNYVIQQDKMSAFAKPETVTSTSVSPVVAQPSVFAIPKVGRNDPCPCGSGKKYKRCCMKKNRA